MALKVIGDRVMVQQDAEEETKSGIILPDSAKEKPQRGTVIAVGEGRVLDNGELAPPPVKVGDRILSLDHTNEYVRMYAKLSLYASLVPSYLAKPYQAQILPRISDVYTRVRHVVHVHFHLTPPCVYKNINKLLPHRGYAYALPAL